MRLHAAVLTDAAEVDDRLVAELHRGGLDVTATRAGTWGGLVELGTPRPDVVIVDLGRAELDLAEVMEKRPRRLETLPLVVVADPTSEDMAIRCLRLGASDYVLSDRLARLPQAVRSAVVTHRLRRDRERNLRKLERSEARYRTLFMEDLTGLFISTPNGRLLDCNPAFARMIGVSGPDEARGVDVWSLYRDPTARRRMLDDLAAGKTVFLREHALVTVKGRPIHVVESAVGTMDSSGRLVQVAGYLLDVTGRRDAEKHRDLLATAVEAAGEAVVITDLNGVIQYVNPAFETITGYGRDEAIGAKPSILSSGEQGEEFYAALWSTITAGRVWMGNFTNRRKDGSLYEEESSISPVRDPLTGRIVNYVAIKRDVTRERSLQAQLHATQRFESLGRIAGAVAHDFNNLLTVVDASATLARAHVLEDSEAVDELELISSAAQRGSTLTRQLLAFARHQRLEPEILDLADVVRGMEALLRRLLGEGTGLSLGLDGEEPRTVEADRGQLEQVLLNLASNARDAMPGGGTLRIDLGREVVERPLTLDAGSLRDIAPGRYVTLTVSDTGCGMDGGTIARAFEPFFTTKPDGRGTGLGLSTVYGIVRQSGGYTRLRSEPGRGTSITLLLPEVLGVVASRGSAAPVKGPPRGGAETVLLIEDQEHVRASLERSLRHLGYTVLVAGGPDEAFEAAADAGSGLDLILCDVGLPGMSGYDLVRALVPKRSRAPVLFMSGYEQEETSGSLPRDAAFLKKPFGVDDLARAVRVALDCAGMDDAR